MNKIIKRTKILSVVTDTFAYFTTHFRLMRFFWILLIPIILNLEGLASLVNSIVLHLVIGLLYASMLVMMIRHIVLERSCSMVRVIEQFKCAYFWRFMIAISACVGGTSLYLWGCFAVLMMGIDIMIAVSSHPAMIVLFLAASLVTFSLAAMLIFLLYIAGYIAIVTTNIAASRQGSIQMANTHFIQEGFYFIGGLSISVLPLFIAMVLFVGTVYLPGLHASVYWLAAGLKIIMSMICIYTSLLPTIFVAMFYRCLHRPTTHNKHRIRTRKMGLMGHVPD